VTVQGEAAGGTAVEESDNGTGQRYPLFDGASFSVRDPSVKALGLNLPESVLKDLPKAFTLKGNYPNPFREATRFVLDLPEDATVSVEVYNILGQRVLRIDEQPMSSGLNQELRLQSSLASGVYLYRLQARAVNGKTTTKTGKMMVVR